MGFSDKLKNGIQNTTSKTFEVFDSAGYNTKISGKKSDIAKVEGEIGQKIYGIYTSGESTFGDDVIKLCDDIKKLYADIDELEAQKKDKADKAHAERKARRDSEED
ncbi:MAG: hypothetical protein LBV63_04945 [Candidatus Methanoplasma sp.]|jgi:hypothetical protein|nr:hypothetical protein [Candidatus Methanoplasma sp.]